MGKVISGRCGVMSLRAALRRARELGATVGDNPGTGEVRIRFLGIGTLNHNARRKDASRALLLLIRKAEARDAGHDDPREGWAA